MDKIYIGSFIRINGVLKVLYQDKHCSTYFRVIDRKIYTDKNGTYFLLMNEKKYFNLPENLKVNFIDKNSGTEYLIVE